jgi:hypothetical protein
VRDEQGGKRGEPQPVWETEASHRMCVVSRYAQRVGRRDDPLAPRDGVTYFKWDAIGQYGCDDPSHDHGDASEPRRASGPSGSRSCCRCTCPTSPAASRPPCRGAICDFDMTESHRCVGLAFLAAGKFFLINNGPYSWDYDIPTERMADGNVNLFFHPGPARTWFMRAPLAYDRWVPVVAAADALPPDDGAANQENAVASLALGQHGMWGDLPGVPPEGSGAHRRASSEVQGRLRGRHGRRPSARASSAATARYTRRLTPPPAAASSASSPATPGSTPTSPRNRPALPAWHGENVSVTLLGERAGEGGRDVRRQGQGQDDRVRRVRRPTRFIAGGKSRHSTRTGALWHNETTSSQNAVFVGFGEIGRISKDKRYGCLTEHLVRVENARRGRARAKWRRAEATAKHRRARHRASRRRRLGAGPSVAHKVVEENGNRFVGFTNDAGRRSTRTRASRTCGSTPATRGSRAVVRPVPTGATRL